MNKKVKCKLVLGIITIVLLFSNTKTEFVNASAGTQQKYITIGEYVKLVVQALDIKVKTKTTEGYIDAAIENGILFKENEFKDYSKDLTRAQCALLTVRAYEILYGIDYDNDTINSVKTLNRISDLGKISAKYQDAVVKVFSSGIIVGYSDGKYTHTRTFKGNSTITVKGAKEVIKRLKTKKERQPMTKDGQLIRTTKLPVNASEYEYILASFPNEYYEMMFSYERGESTCDLIKEGYAYAPVNVKNIKYRRLGYVGTVEEEREIVKKYSQNWTDIVQKHIELLFNVNYKTIDSSWAKKLAKTYYASDDEDYQKIYNHIKAYIKVMKKNHVVCETSQVSVDKSSLYYHNGYKLRVYVRYRMKADDMSNTSVLLYDRSGNCTFTQTKKWVWKECCFDISVGANDGSRGDDYAVDNFFLTDCDYTLKTKLLKPVYDKEKERYVFR